MFTGFYTGSMTMKMKFINNNSFIYFFLYPVANTPTRELLIKNNQTQPQSFHAMNTFFHSSV